MNTGNYCIAGLPVNINTLFGETHLMCTEYRTEEPPILNICTCQQDIVFELKKAEQENERAGFLSWQYSDAYLETLAVYRKIAEIMPEYDTFLFHGSAIAVDGKAYIFTAKSGTGKSTHAMLWRKLMGDKAVMVNDDKPLVKVHKDGAATVYGTPWDGKHHLSHNMAVPLKAVCILKRAEENRIREISKSEALPMLIQQAYRPANPASLAKTLTLLDRLRVQYYQLSCNMNIDAAALAYGIMSE